MCFLNYNQVLYEKSYKNKVFLLENELKMDIYIID